MAAASLPLYLFTFNCGRDLINPQAIATNFFSTLDPAAPPPEIVAIGLQEIAPISYSFLGGDFLTPYLDRWSSVPHLASQLLHKQDPKFPPEYVEIGRSYVGMTALLLFSSRPEKVKSLRFTGVGFGVAGMGNKGAVAARFTHIEDNGYGDTGGVDVTIVTAHLAAHEHCCADRNRDWETLARGLVFDSPISNPSEATPLLQDSAPDSSSASSPASGIYAPNTHLFVLGDLNYRVSHTAPTPSDYRLFPKQPSDLSEYFARDQLTTERKAGHTLHGLTEAPINFSPTYKYPEIRLPRTASPTTPNLESNKLEPNQPLLPTSALFAYAPHRWPSWCDRILWLPLPDTPSRKGNDITIHRYSSIPTILHSDHRPVTLHVSLPGIPSSSRETNSKDDLRQYPPFPLDANWRSSRAAAVSREWIVGYAILMVTTTGGVALVTCAVVGVGMLWWTMVGCA
ncbi:hypothetical protein H072_8486 [Dactylellina haptotyla CBS 200.50]|uniref:Inositol polyphosphate-related phosphatase domain-containing protein n=1 Tax=Dactylellina haptotyla (strain CBS 200.50) TaxID=1284197 RepID=S8A4J1_DACHA|nr:hypothetical protein H072_8486 [Dactylellina haptotyla CBS 200.50]